MSEIRPPDCSKLAKNPKKDNDAIIFRHDVNVNFFKGCFVSLVKFSYWSKSHVNTITGSGIWQLSFIRDWSEIRKSEIPTSEFFPISGEWGELWIPNLARMSLIECYWMLQNSMVIAFTAFELLRENQLGGGGLKLPPLPQPKLGLKCSHKEISIGNQTVEMIEILSSCHFFYLWYQKGLEESKKGSDVVKISLNLWWVSHRLILIA